MGVLTADGGLLVFHLVPDAQKTVHSFLKFSVLLTGDLSLMAEFGLPSFDVLIVG